MQFNLNFPPSHYIPQKGVRKRKKEKTGRLAYRERKYFKKSLKQQPSQRE